MVGLFLKNKKKERERKNSSILLFHWLVKMLSHFFSRLCVKRHCGVQICEDRVCHELAPFFVRSLNAHYQANRPPFSPSGSVSSLLAPVANRPTV